MKKIMLVCVVFVFLVAGCATATFEKGDMKLTVSRPIFSSVSAGAISADGDMVTINASTSVAVDQLAQTAIAGYAKYMSGGLVSAPVATPQAVLVPKAEAQATPPPAEIPLVR